MNFLSPSYAVDSVRIDCSRGYDATHAAIRNAVLRENARYLCGGNFDKFDVVVAAQNYLPYSEIERIGNTWRWDRQFRRGRIVKPGQTHDNACLTFIPHVNNVGLLQQAVESIAAPNMNIWVVDSSADGLDVTADWLSPCTVLRLPYETTFTQMQNEMLKRASDSGVPYLIFMHSDARARDKQVVADLLAGMKPTTGVAFTNYDAMACFNMDCCRQVGAWDESYSWYSSDCDYYRRIQLQGFSLVPLPMSDRVEHVVSATIKTGPSYSVTVEAPGWDVSHQAHKWGSGVCNGAQHLRPYAVSPTAAHPDDDMAEQMGELYRRVEAHFGVLSAGLGYVEGNISLGLAPLYCAVLLKMREQEPTLQGTPRILEIGFNAGHSSALLSECFPGAEIVSVDIGQHEYVQPAFERLKAFSRAKHTLVIGDSRVEVPKLAGPFDLIFIDGGHIESVPFEDLHNGRKLAHDSTIVFMDDVCNAWSNMPPTFTWARAVEDNTVIELGRRELTSGTLGFVYGKYVNPGDKKRVLLKFNHGLGDAVQFGIVLRHLHKYRPDLRVDVLSLYGKHSALRGMCAQVFSDRDAPPAEKDYSKIIDIAWHENYESYAQVPSTKAARCITELFQLEPDPELFTYVLRPTQAAEQAAEQYLRELTGVDAVNGRWPVVFLHYQGNTAVDSKNLPHGTALEVCQRIAAAGLIPVFFDWDHRSPFIDNIKIHCPTAEHPIWRGHGTGDAGIIAALIARAQLMIGIDSGPLHVAGATSTPTIGVWTGHWPTRYLDFADNITHSVPAKWRDNVDKAQTALFERTYRYVERSSLNIATDICNLAARLLRIELPVVEVPALVRARDMLVRVDNVGPDITIVDDVYHKDCYKLGEIADCVKQARVVVDVGAHIGAFAKLVHEKNPGARIICVEACPENIEALRANVGAFAEVVHAACTYVPGDVALCNSVRPNCRNTGQSSVVPAADVHFAAADTHWPDRRPLEKITLEQLAARFGFKQIDLLKLDCEGSEYSILGNCDLSAIGFIVGEYHGQLDWDEFRAEHFADWDYGHMLQAADSGNFHLRNFAYKHED